MTTRTVNGRVLRKSTFSGSGNDCVYLSGIFDLVHDSKGNVQLDVPAAGLVAFARRLGGETGDEG